MSVVPSTDPMGGEVSSKIATNDVENFEIDDGAAGTQPDPRALRTDGRLGIFPGVLSPLSKLGL